MSEPRDDDRELRAMLEARASRVPASTPREVMAAVRQEMQAPREGAAFAVVPLLAGRRRGAGLGWVAAALVAVVVLAVVGRGSFTSPSSATNAASAVVSSSPVTGPSGATDVSLAGLRQALADGSLDGRIVLVDTTLRETPLLISCVSVCPRFWALDLVGPVVTDRQPGEPIVPAVLNQALPSLAGTWVVVPHAGMLFLAGRVSDPIYQPMTWADLESRPGPVSIDPSGTTLEPIRGWLVHGGPNVTDRVISEQRPAADGTPAGTTTVLTLEGPAPGIDPASVVTEGPFLVRTAPGSKARVVARYEPASLVRVAMPTITCPPVPSDPAMACDDAVGAALTADQWPSPITSIKFDYITPSSGQVVIRHQVASQDLVVDVRANADGSVVVRGSGPLASDGPAIPSPAASTPAPGAGSVPLDAVGLRTALASGSLDGAVVLVDGTLAERPIPCTSPSTPEPCFELYLPAVAGITVSEGRGPGAARPSALPAGSLVFVVGGGGLTFLGAWATWRADPITVDALLGQASVPAYDDLALVSGWLVVGGIHSCPMLGPGATPCPGPLPWLAVDEPNQDGLLMSDKGVTVGLDPSGVVGTPSAIVTPGPFLLRHAYDTPCDHGTQPGGVTCAGTQTGWEVVAALAGRSIVRAVLPPVACADVPHGQTTRLTCGGAVTAALAVVLSGSAVTSIEFAYGDSMCPPWVPCEAAMPPNPDAGHVVLHVASPGPDLWVMVVADGDGAVSVASPVAFPRWWPAASPTTSTSP